MNEGKTNVLHLTSCFVNPPRGNLWRLANVGVVPKHNVHFLLSH